MFEDREDNLWIGTSGGGLTRFKPRRIQNFGAESGLAEPVVSSLWPSQDGGLWIATRGKGLFRLRDGVVTPVPPIPKKVMIAQSVLTDRQGRVWLGTGQDLWVADAGAFRRAYPDRLSGADVHALFEDSRGRLWIGAAKGTSVVDEEQLRAFTAADGLPARGAYAFTEDSHGVIWLSTRDGVFRSEHDRFVELLDDNGRPLRNINCFKSDADKALWMGSRDEGLIYRTQAGRLARVPGLPVRAVNKVFAGTNVTRMKLEAFKYYYAPAGDTGVAGIVARPIPELIKLQQAVIDAVAPFTVDTGPWSAFVTTADDPNIAALIEYVRTFVPKLTASISIRT